MHPQLPFFSVQVPAPLFFETERNPNLDVKELAEFVDTALEPIIGTKKKEMDRQTVMQNIMIQIVDKMGIEAFTQSLQNLSPGPDTPKAM